MASVETNVYMPSTYTHIYFKHISKQKNVCLLLQPQKYISKQD